jgi:hypothetical protein
MIVGSALRNYDATGLLLHRLGSGFFGFWMGTLFAHYPVVVSYGFVALFFGIAMFWLAHIRAKQA